MKSTSEVKYCRNTASVYATANDAGGIIGLQINSGDASLTPQLTDSCNEGDVSASSLPGGIVGYISGNIYMRYCYNTGHVYAYGGGFAGCIAARNNDQYTSRLSVAIYMCYNVGEIQSDGITGGILGYSKRSSNVTRCFHLSGISDVGSGSTSSLIYSLSQEDMKTLGGYIVSPYIQDTDNINNGYPILNSIDYTAFSEGDGSGTFKYTSSNNNNRDYESTYYYNDNYFNASSYTYNESLSTMSLCLALSAFGSNEKDYVNKSDNASALMEDIGFSEIKCNSWFRAKPTTDSIGVIAGEKSISTDSGDYTLIAVAIRGGGYEKEWASNLTLGRTGQHEGFSDAKDQVLKFLKEYISEKDIKGNIKLWLVGYSRAGAAANLVAGAIDDGEILGNCILKPQDMYAYCFEPPQGALKSEIGSEIYNNIFNIVNVNDLVGYVAPTGMGFDRFGVKHVLPNRNDYNDYSSALALMLEKYYAMDSVTDKYLIDDFTSHSIQYSSEIKRISIVNDGLYPQGAFLGDFVNILSKEIIKSRGNYVDSLQQDIREICSIAFGSDFSRLGDILADKVVTNLPVLFIKLVTFESGDYLYELVAESLDEANISDYDGEQLKNVVNKVVNIVAKIFSTYYDDAITLIMNMKSIGEAHYPEVCLAWLQSMDPNYTPKGRAAFSTGSYRTVRVNCPVDIEVYNMTGELVAAIYDDVPQKMDTQLSAISNDDEKIVFLPPDGSYEVKLIAIYDGEMDIAINEWSFDLGDIARIINYNEIAIKNGDEFTLTVPAYSDVVLEHGTANGSGTEYVLTSLDGSTIDSDIELNGQDAADAYYIVTLESEIENAGFITGQGIRQLGHYALVSATAYEGYKFTGWYDGDKLVSSEQEYRFRVENDITLTARWDTLSEDSEGYTIIKTAEQLDSVRNNPSGKYRLYADIDLTGYISKTFTEKNGWYPIGYGKPFPGIFDGNNHTVSGLWSGSGWGISYKGLFSVVSGGTVSNLNLELAEAGITGNYEIGGIAGVAKNGAVIDSCTVSGGSITVTGGGYSGGLIGFAYGNPAVSILNCSVNDVSVKTSGNYSGGLVGALNSSNISGSSSSARVIAGTSYAGGLVGAAYGGSEIKDSCATGDVQSKYYSGGLVGTLYEYSTVATSFATGNVTTEYYVSGGLVGEAIASTIENCYAQGNVSGTTGVGGLVGYFSGSGTNNNKTVFNSYSCGKVTGKGTTEYGAFNGRSGVTYLGTNYYDSNTASVSNGYGTSGSPKGDSVSFPEGKSTQSMKQQSTYTGWDFDEIWQIDEDKSYPYFKR